MCFPPGLSRTLGLDDSKMVCHPQRGRRRQLAEEVVGVLCCSFFLLGSEACEDSLRPQDGPAEGGCWWNSSH